MNYRLHPEAREDLPEAAEFYRDNAGVALSQSLLAEFEQSVNLLLEHPRLGGKWIALAGTPETWGVRTSKAAAHAAVAFCAIVSFRPTTDTQPDADPASASGKIGHS